MSDYTLAQIIEMTFAVQKHQINNDLLPALISEFEQALLGIPVDKAEQAFKHYLDMLTDMPTPQDILIIISSYERAAQ